MNTKELSAKYESLVALYETLSSETGKTVVDLVARVDALERRVDELEAKLDKPAEQLVYERKADDSGMPPNLTAEGQARWRESMERRAKYKARKVLA